MEFLRENILKIVTIIIIFIIAIVAFTFGCSPKVGIKKVKSYSDMENLLVSTTKKYVSENKKLLPKSDGKITKINLDTLIESDYINEQTAIEDSNVKCSGYTQILNKKDKYVYMPYIKCGKYYETRTIANQILSTQEIVTSDDGLYKFGDVYVFRGENPNNYLKLGEKLYRILEINEDNELKLISTVKYPENISWDDRYNLEKDKEYGINDYTRSRLKDSLENMLNNNEFFSSQEREKIVSHDICIGKRNPSDFSKNMNSECSYKYPNQKVGLILAAEYSRVSTDNNCNGLNAISCKNYNYLNTITGYFITMTGSSLDTYNVININNGVMGVIRASRNFSAYPVVYIDKLSTYYSGDGTIEKPYLIK